MLSRILFSSLLSSRPNGDLVIMFQAEKNSVEAEFLHLYLGWNNCERSILFFSKILELKELISIKYF